MKYRIYIDEVGNPDLQSSDNPNHRFLSLTGAILELEYVNLVIHPRMEALKQKYFRSHPDEPVIFHRKEMINAKPPFQALRDSKFREDFNRELLAQLASWDYTIISVCLDKKRHKETYQAWRYDPYHYCLAVMLERYVFFLNNLKAEGDVMAESRGGKEDLRLKKSFTRLWTQGTEYVNPEQFQNALTSRELKVKTKQNNIAGLQIADLAAHPSRNEILKENNMINEEIAPFAQEVIAILQSKYHQRDGKIYGKKFF